MVYPINNIIIERTLTNRDPKGKPLKVQVLIGQPNKRKNIKTNLEDWYCPYQILGIGDNTTAVTFGMDSIQALYHTMMIIGERLKLKDSQGEYLLTWNDVPNFGFPKAEFELSQKHIDIIKNLPADVQKKYSHIMP